MTLFRTILVTLLISGTALAGHYEDRYQAFKTDGFEDAELVELYHYLSQNPHTKTQVRAFTAALLSPYAPENSHTGQKFFQALSWYHDTTSGNRNGKFSLRELEKTMKKEAQNYLARLQDGAADDDRLATWKMLQKLKLIQKEIIRSGKSYYPYQKRQLGQVNFNGPWNKLNTIRSTEQFQKRVIEASFNRPVLIKFGLTYCVHCLLMENLGSVPAVAKKYRDVLDTYKLWWNPKDQAYSELNQIAADQGVTSSPFFILYRDGRQVNAGYAFPDHNGEGMEEFLSPVL
ncbi:MAG: thioredoxin family protein [Halobacteriovoraceae bacterium]|jgi:hypothetical protein|nr:thioredoxin family protein [Halobacteriovoraceae bacterium]